MAERIVISVAEGWDDCECCGSFDWERVEVIRGGKVVLSHVGDGHLGGAMWHNWQDAVREILTALGHTVEFEDK